MTFIFRATIVTPVLWTWVLIRFPFVVAFTGSQVFTSNLVAPAVRSAVATAAMIAETLGPRGMVFSVAVLLVLFFTAFIVIMTDPLLLRRAAFSCAKAGRVAAHATKVRDPMKHLNWKAGDRRLVDLDLLDKLGEYPPALGTNQLIFVKGRLIPTHSRQTLAVFPSSLLPINCHSP
jgi:hypothetical protein